MPTSPDARSPERIRHHYEVEKELARRLKGAAAEERRDLYTQVYDEMFGRVPDHPLLTRKLDADAMAERISVQMHRLDRFLHPHSTFMELGPGDCSFALAVAKRVERVFAIDVSAEHTGGAEVSPNFELILSDGSSIPVPEGSVDVAYSDQLLEHLHPEDALRQIENVHRALKPGGLYLCITPNRLNGPWDVSRDFDEEATGFHLKEYTLRELVEIFRGAGFRSFQSLVGARGRDLLVPVAPQCALERALESLPSGLRCSIGRTLPMTMLLSIKLLARK